MKKQFCSYEIALKLKELGFDEPCFGYWRKENVPCPLTICKYTESIDSIDDNNFPNFDCLAPLWQQAIVFLMDKLDFKFPHLTIKIFSDYSGDINLYKSMEAEESFQNLEECANVLIKLLTEQNQNK
jgi:hypothetical protein